MVPTIVHLTCLYRLSGLLLQAIELSLSWGYPTTVSHYTLHEGCVGGETTRSFDWRPLALFR